MSDLNNKQKKLEALLEEMRSTERAGMFPMQRVTAKRFANDLEAILEESTSSWRTNLDGFREALNENEHAEYLLELGVILITDEDSPAYIMAPDDYTEQMVDDILVDSEFESDGVEYDEHNDVYYVHGLE